MSTILPFFTSTGMRDAERVSTVSARLCPRQILLPFQIQRNHLTTTYLTELALVDCDGNETDIFDYAYSAKNLIIGWTNPGAITGYDTFISTGSSILTAINSPGGDEVYCYSNEFALSTGDSVKVSYNLTLNADDLPTLYLGKSDGSIYSAGVLTATGSNTAYLLSTGNNLGNVSLLVRNESGNNTSFASTFDVVKNSLEIDEFTTYDFITYNGTPLSTELPYGVYYLRVSFGDEELLQDNFYSEWFTVKDLQTNLLTSLSNVSYNTLTLTGISISTAISAGSTRYAISNRMTVRNGEKILVTYDIELTSGQQPLIYLVDSSDYANEDITSEGPTSTVRGINHMEFTIIKSTTYARLRIGNTAATTFSMSSISARHESGDYIHLKFTNSKDFNKGDDSILYQNGFTQQAYLDTYLNNPMHEVLEVGDEKNGVFIAEKIIDKFIYNIVSYESRTMFEALRLLPLHDDIKILDEVGNEYTPDVGNVRVGIDWTTYDTGTLRIDFNEDGDIWTNNMENIS